MGEDFKLAESKEIYLGGCLKLGGAEQPVYHCYKCNRSYFKDLKKYIETKKFYEELGDFENIIDNGEDK